MTAALLLVLKTYSCHWEGPSIHVGTKKPARGRVAIVLCKFADQPDETFPRLFFQNYYTRRGGGAMADYWNDVTFGAVDLTTSKVFGWFTMPHDTSEVRQLVFPGGRNTLVQWGVDAAYANHVDLSQFDHVLVVQNWGIDHGAAGNGVIIAHRRDVIESTFIAHEMGHLFGLPHSFGPSGEYGDPWDIMSAMSVYLMQGTRDGIPQTSGPGLNAFAAKALGALKSGRIVAIQARAFDRTIEIAPLNQPLQTGVPYVVDIGSAGRRFTIEYRHKAGWDAALPHDAVLVHEEKDGRSVLLKDLVQGQDYTVPSNAIDIYVEAIDDGAQRARVHVRSGRTD